MNLVFLDTAGLVALWNEADQWNEAASAAMKALDAGRKRLVTTTWVLVECGNALARTSFRRDLAEFRERLMRQGDVIEPTGIDMEEGWREYGGERAGGASIVDHISFVIMRKLGIADVFSNDRHFKMAGFTTLF